MTVEKLMEIHRMNTRQLSDRFEIPYRTVQNWKLGLRECPEYIIKMMNEILERDSE